MMNEKQSFLGFSMFMHLGAMVIVCSKYRIHDGMQEMCQMCSFKVEKAKFYNALLSWGTAE